MAPRAKFTFKTKKNASAISLNDAAELAAQGRRPIPGYSSPDASSLDSSFNPTPNYASTPVNELEQQQLRPEIGPTSPLARSERSAANDNDENDENMENTYRSPIRRPTFSNASTVSVHSHHGLHIMLPASASHSTVPASITNLRHCVLDMSIPAANGKPYASLTIKDVQESLLICGQVEGPAHITGIKQSVIVISCRQFRMHNCSNVDVYLSCSSNPIIEDCNNVRFGRIPRAYVSEDLFHYSALFYFIHLSNVSNVCS